MKRLILVAFVAVVLGYKWGYGEGTAGKPSVATRTWARFGTAKVKSAQDTRNKRVDEASKP